MFGGGVFTLQDKVLPGAYINFVSATRATSVLSERGICAMAVELDWGPEGSVFELTSDVFRDNSFSALGFSYTDEKLKNLRELFRGARTAYLYRMNSGGAKAANTYATAKYSGVRGNDLSIVVETNALDAEQFDVITVLAGTQVDVQTVPLANSLVPNAFVDFKETAVLEPTAGLPLEGGTNGTATNQGHQTFLGMLEGYTYNTLGCASTDETVKALYTAYTKRMRDEHGLKFQTVLHKHAADYEGVISVENNATPELVYWVTGKEAGCPVNASLMNTTYDGEYGVSTDFTQRQLEQGIKGGKFMFHRAYREVRVLADINTLVTLTELKGKDFTVNQTIRVLDQIGNDIALLFNTKYLGKMPSNDSGRVSLWGDIVAHFRELEALGAIEPFDPADIEVMAGEDKRAVAVIARVTPINAMERLYMTVYVA